VVALIDGVLKVVPLPNELPPVATENQLSVPAEAVAPKLTVPDPVLDPGVVLVTEGLAFTVMFAVLFPLMVELQLLGGFPPLANFVIVMVEVPELDRVLVVKFPEPAVVTFIVAVFPIAVFAAVKLYVTVYVPAGSPAAVEETDMLALFVTQTGDPADVVLML
jgi:hypothetical protein